MSASLRLLSRHEMCPHHILLNTNVHLWAAQYMQRLIYHFPSSATVTQGDPAKHPIHSLDWADCDKASCEKMCTGLHIARGEAQDAMPELRTHHNPCRIRFSLGRVQVLMWIMTLWPTMLVIPSSSLTSTHAARTPTAVATTTT